MKEFELDVNKTTKIMTTVAFFILFAFGAYCISCGFIETVLFLSVLSFVVFLFLLMPVKVKLEPGYIIVKRIAGHVKIPINSIENIKIANLSRIVFGSGGIFGWYGIFDIDGRNVFVYSRKNTNVVFITCKYRTYGIGVKNPEEFIKSLKETIQSC